jgi:hypothetical protein
MNSYEFKELIKKIIKENLKKVYNMCELKIDDNDYIFQDNKYNIESNKEEITYMIESLNDEDGVIKITNVKNLHIPLTKKIIVNYSEEVLVDVIDTNTLKLLDINDIYLLSVGDIITTDNGNNDKNKIYIIVDVDNVAIRNDYITDTHDNTVYTVNLFIGTNDFNNNKEKYNFIFNEILRIFRVHSISTVYKEKEIVLQTVIKPHYNTYVNTENDRVSYVVLNLSHIYNKNLRI